MFSKQMQISNKTLWTWQKGFVRITKIELGFENKSLENRKIILYKIMFEIIFQT
jgi:hypothetical protein